MTTLSWPTGLRLERVPGLLKQHNDDFRVEERLPELPSGEGEHLWVEVEKDGQNTAWVARQLARWAGCKPRDVSYAGLKDRHGITRQTFSVHLPGKTAPSEHLFHVDGVRILSVNRHHRKLKTGQLIGNRFRIRVRNTGADEAVIRSNWSQVCRTGVPNYFGPQRFGRQGQNIETGVALLLGQEKRPRHQQSIFLSAVRSWLFNDLLSNRIEANTWDQVIPGDFVQFTEGKTGFYCAEVDDDTVQRCADGKLSACASLIGLNREPYPELDQRERGELAEHQAVIDALESRKVMRQFRKLRLFVEQPELEFVEGDPVFSFFLPAGAYATTVLSELFELDTESEAGNVDE
ncbi:tRNA pseudouridine(13) synthase TruD [Reinekea blandensis]|uniref:tRNA pseudouridine synthase D n=1 Tax=Reinekea blandensis MED297 TaxID=314283 RepID=A4BCI1_9GAMM|nr:tRNA pseudouridine(13) synthase TruD [Reinekea blandensis]EAR10247.1 Pseudouridylate synthase [Reinekea sp. MED297] [Reinekea blandensis MED297]